MRYEGDVYRPPGEWRSYILQATIGCSHNKCTFCGMYKNKFYRERDLEEVFEDIDIAKVYYGGKVKRVFVCDGDAIGLPMDYWLALLDKLYSTFPQLERVTTYAGPQSTLTKTVGELKQLKEAGLYRAYLGVESGYDKVLRDVHKGIDAEGMLQVGRNLIEAGIDLWCTILMGLGGKEDSYMHAVKTAELINKMKPQHVSAMTLMLLPQTKLYRDVKENKFVELTTEEALMETRTFIEHIDIDDLHFTSNHASNYVPLKGTLKQDKEKMIGMIDAALSGKGEVAVRPEGHRRL